MKTWSDMSDGLMGARVKNISPSETRTFVLFAETNRAELRSRAMAA